MTHPRTEEFVQRAYSRVGIPLGDIRDALWLSGVLDALTEAEGKAAMFDRIAEYILLLDRGIPREPDAVTLEDCVQYIAEAWEEAGCELAEAEAVNAELRELVRWLAPKDTIHALDICPPGLQDAFRTALDREQP